VPAIGPRHGANRPQYRTVEPGQGAAATREERPLAAPVTPSASNGPRRRSRGSWPWGVHRSDAAWLLGIACLVYLPAPVVGYFRSDDFNLGMLYRPGSLADWQLLREALSCRTPADFFYRPVGYVFLAGSYAVWGPNPVGYFVVNQTVHGLAGLLLRAAVRELGWGRGAAVMAGAAFLLHPLHAETVWWVVGAFDLLAGLFASAVLWAYARWLRHGGTPSLVAIVAGYGVAIFAKEAAVTLPAVLAIASIVRAPGSSRRTWTQYVGLYLALALVTGGGSSPGAPASDGGSATTPADSRPWT
jgi:hypothetical protein